MYVYAEKDVCTGQSVVCALCGMCIGGKFRCAIGASMSPLHSQRLYSEGTDTGLPLVQVQVLNNELLVSGQR